MNRLSQRATSFIRRELRVWRHLDVEVIPFALHALHDPELTPDLPQFLTTYIVSLMKSIDIRSEPAVRLLADFLDERGSTGRDRRGAEQFAHGMTILLVHVKAGLTEDGVEVYSFLRSPYRDLALYDAIVQVSVLCFRRGGELTRRR